MSIANLLVDVIFYMIVGTVLAIMVLGAAGWL